MLKKYAMSTDSRFAMRPKNAQKYKIGIDTSEVNISEHPLCHSPATMNQVFHSRSSRRKIIANCTENPALTL